MLSVVIVPVSAAVPDCRPKLPFRLKALIYLWAIWQVTQVLLLWSGTHHGHG